METIIEKITHPYPQEIYQARVDESIVTGVPMVERPYWYRNTGTGQLYYDLAGCVGWPSEVTDRDKGMPGYVAIIGIVKLDGTPAKDAGFQLLAEREDDNVETILDYILELRKVYGYPEILKIFVGDHERYIQAIALRNERLERGKGIMIAPPNEIGKADAFDEYHRALSSVLRPGHFRFFFGKNYLLRNKLMEFKRDNPAVFAMGGLIHNLLTRVQWMDQQGDINCFNLEDS